MAEKTDDLVLRIERVFHAPIEHVFRAWTDPAALARWFGPQGMSIPEVDCDARPGGRYRVVMRAPGGHVHTVTGEFRAVEPPRRLVMTWGWMEGETRGHETLVEVELIDQGRSTLMRFTQQVFASRSARDAHREGWAETWPGLDAFLAG